MTDVQSNAATDATDATDAPVAHFKIWLDEVGIEIGRSPLDPKNVPFTNDDGDLVIPHQSLKFTKGPKVAEKGYRIFLGPVADGETPVDYAEVKTIDIPVESAEIRTKGRQPKGSYKNADGDTVVPFAAPDTPKADRFLILLDAKGGVIERVKLGKNHRMRKGCTRDDAGNITVPWHVTTGQSAPVETDETDKAPDTETETTESPVVAEQDAPPVESVQEPADVS